MNKKKENPLNDKDVIQLVKYEDRSRNCLYYVYESNKKTLYKYDLDTEEITAIHLEENEIKYANGESPMIYGVDHFGVHGDYIFIVANNGGSGSLFGQYLIAYNTLDGTFSEIDFATEIKLINENRKAEVMRKELTKEGKCMAENEYETWTEIINLP